MNGDKKGIKTKMINNSTKKAVRNRKARIKRRKLKSLKPRKVSTLVYKTLWSRKKRLTVAVISMLNIMKKRIRRKPMMKKKSQSKQSLGGSS